MRIVPDERQFYVHPRKQDDGRMTVQLVGHFDVYNLSDQPIVLTDVRPVKPRITGTFIRRSVDVQDSEGRFFGQYAVPPRTKVDGSVMIMAYQDFSWLGEEVKVVLKVSDQFGRRYRLKVDRVRRA